MTARRRWATGSRPRRDAAGSRSTPRACCASGASASSSLTRIELLIEPANLASRRVAERLGAVHEGLASHEANGRTYEMSMYGLRP